MDSFLILALFLPEIHFRLHIQPGKTGETARYFRGTFIPPAGLVDIARGSVKDDFRDPVIETKGLIVFIWNDRFTGSVDIAPFPVHKCRRKSFIKESGLFEPVWNDRLAGSIDEPVFPVEPD